MGAEHLLDRLPEKLRLNGLVRLASTPEAQAPTGGGPLQSEPARGELVRPGTIAARPSAGPLSGEALQPNAHPRLLDFVSPGLIELPLEQGDSMGTELGLRLASELQREPSRPWVAFVDPLGTLHAPGASAHGVLLERLLVVRPRQEALRRVLVRLVESEIFALVVIDLAGTPTEPVEEHLGSWVRVTRRLTVALRGGSQRVLLLTNRKAARPLPLAVSRRLEVSRVSTLLG